MREVTDEEKFRFLKLYLINMVGNKHYKFGAAGHLESDDFSYRRLYKKHGQGWNRRMWTKNKKGFIVVKGPH